jgi:DNA segregation ATPase FtsK/SpoIIIE-like protein
MKNSALAKPANFAGVDLGVAYQMVRNLQLLVVDVMQRDYKVRVLPHEFLPHQCVTPRYLRFPLELVSGERFYWLKQREPEIAMIAGRTFCVIYMQDGVIWCLIPRKQTSVVELERVLEVVPTHQPGYAALGLDMEGRPRAASLISDDKPHTLISGTSGSGKSIFQKAVVTSMALWASPAEVNFVLCDVKGGETFGVFDSDGERLIHMAKPLLVDTGEILEAASWLAQQTVERQRAGVRKPALMFFIDEIADVLRTEPRIENYLARILERGRSAGVHIVAATNQANAKRLGQLPGLFKFRVTLAQVRAQDAVAATTRGNSRANFLGMQGDMLVGDENAHLQGFMVSDEQIRKLLRDAIAPVELTRSELAQQVEAPAVVAKIVEPVKAGRPKSDFTPEEVAQCLAYREQHGNFPSVSAISRGVLGTGGMYVERAKRLLVEVNRDGGK